MLTARRNGGRGGAGDEIVAFQIGRERKNDVVEQIRLVDLHREPGHELQRLVEPLDLAGVAERSVHRIHRRVQQHFHPMRHPIFRQVLDGDREQRMEMRGQREKLADVGANRLRRRAARKRLRMRQRHMTAAVLQQAVDADLRPPMMRVLAGSSGAQNASRHVHRPDDDVHQLERPALVESVRVALRAFRPIDADRPVGQFGAVDRDRFADARRGAEFARHAPNGRRRNRRDLLDVFRRVSLDVLAQQLECRPALSPVRLIGSGDRRIAQARIIVNFDRVVGQVVEQGLPCRRIAQITPVRADQVGSIGLMLEELLVVDVHLVEQHLQHGEGERRIGAGTDRQPLVGFARGVTAHRIDRNELHAPLRGLRPCRVHYGCRSRAWRRRTGCRPE